MVSFPVSIEKQRQLEEHMQRLGIREEDLVEDFIRGSGAGGQKINKTSVVVSLCHLPTGIRVRCQRGRSQAMNRFHARRLLVDKIEGIILGEKSREQQAREKIRRQKRKRSKRAKEKMVVEKRKVGEKKQLRKRISRNDD